MQDFYMGSHKTIKTKQMKRCVIFMDWKNSIL